MNEEILIRMGLDASAMGSGLRGARKDLDSFKKDAGGFNIGSMVKGGLAGLGIGLSVGALASAAKGAIEYATEIKHLSEELGVSGSTLQAWQMKVSKTGGDSETATKALEHLSLKIGDARRGNEAAAESFSKLGISLKTTDGHAKTTEQVLGDVADRLKDLPDSTQRNSIAFDIFSKSGLKVANALKDGAKGLEDFKKAASGKILSDADIGQLEAMKKLVTGFGRQSMVLAGRALAGITDAGGVSRMLREMDRKQEGGESDEAKAEKGKKVLEAMAKLDKARRDLKFEHLSTEGKLAVLVKEEKDLTDKVQQAEEGSVEQIDLKVERTNKQKEVEQYINKLHDERVEQAKTEAEKQKEKQKALEHQRDVMREISREADKVNKAKDKLSDAKGDRSRFTLEDLANTGIDRYTTGAAAEQIQKARQAEFLQNRARWEAGHGLGDASKADFGEADKIRKGLSMLTEQEQNPFKSLEDSVEEQTDALNELVRKAGAEGIKVDLAVTK